MSALSYLARRFVAGEKMQDAVDAVQNLNADGLRASLDVLGEDVAKPEEAEAAAREYLELLDEIARLKLNSNVSIKLTQMGLEIGEEFCMEQMRKVVAKAASQGNFVRIDMEGSACTERTIKIFKRLHGEFPGHIGVVLQAYLFRSEADAREMAAIQAPIRVCKGAYQEPPSIAFKNMDDIRRSYKTMVEILLKAGCKVGIASHDEKLIRWAVEWTAKEKIPRDLFEFQMLYGLRRKRARMLARDGYAVRTYIPYGSHWFPYFVRRLRERKENIFFVLKSLVAD